jgi:hypothetical protein
MINLEPLHLRLTFHDDTEKDIMLSEALLMDHCNDAWIYAEHENSVFQVFDFYFEEAFVEDGETDRYVLEEDIRSQIEQSLVNNFSILKLSLFDFLPQFQEISQINFQRGNLAVAYIDGSTRDYRITK